MRNILITGANGQLGQELQNITGKYTVRYIFTDINELDICNYNELITFFKQHKIDFIINCAAYTAVDKAESDQEKAELVNATAPENLKKIAAKHKAFLIHVSTDYVFDGMNYKPYSEEDSTNPKSVYGSTKLKGENNVLDYDKAMVIRTSWLYSVFGNNIVKTVLKYGKERDELKFIADQIGSPTNAADLAKTIMDIIMQTIENEGRYQSGIYHFSNEGVCSWYDFAKEIIDLSGIDCKVIPIETKDFPTPASRPHYSVLNKSKIKSDFGIIIPHWKDSLKKCLQKLI